MMAAPRTLGTVVTVLGLLVLIKLGLWQLERAEFKRELMAELAARQTQTVSWPLPAQPAEQLAGFAFQAQVQLMPQHALLLDNQSYQGQVGYRYLHAARVVSAQADDRASRSPWLLLDFGFLAVARGDRSLPELPAIPAEFIGSGRLFRFGDNPLNSALLPEAMQSETGTEKSAITRIQALNLAQLSTYWQQALAPVVLAVEQPALAGVTPVWQPINLQPEKHQGYALQWFGLALALLVISLIKGRAGRRERSSLIPVLNQQSPNKQSLQ